MQGQVAYFFFRFVLVRCVLCGIKTGMVIVFFVCSLFCTGANSGHYTAFSCHPVTNEWYNYNDETVAQQRPGDGEFDNSYVLFFKRQGKEGASFLYVEPPPSALSSPSTAEVRKAPVLLTLNQPPLATSYVLVFKHEDKAASIFSALKPACVWFENWSLTISWTPHKFTYVCWQKSG